MVRFWCNLWAIVKLHQQYSKNAVDLTNEHASVPILYHHCQAREANTTLHYSTASLVIMNEGKCK